MKPKGFKKQKSSFDIEKKFSKICKINESETVKMNTLAIALKAEGRRVYNLSAGEPKVNVFGLIKNEFIKLMDTNSLGYPPPKGIPSLNKAAVDWFNKSYGANFTEEQCMASGGGKFVIYLLLATLLNKGDEAIILSPFWVSYPAMVKMFQAKPVVVKGNEKNNFKVSPKDLLKKITKKTKLIILNNASNPCGTLYSKEEVRDLIKTAYSKGVVVISDEVYSGLTYDKTFTSAASFKEFRKGVCIVHSMSKNFGMTGFRLGFLFAPEAIVKNVIKFQGQTITSPSIASQYAALAAFNIYEKIEKILKKEMRERRDFFIGELNKILKIKIKAPESAFYCFVSLKNLGIKNMNSLKFCEDLMYKGGVASVPGKAFDMEGYVRFSFGETKQELAESITALKKYLTKK